MGKTFTPDDGETKCPARKNTGHPLMAAHPLHTHTHTHTRGCFRCPRSKVRFNRRRASPEVGHKSRFFKGKEGGWISSCRWGTRWRGGVKGERGGGGVTGSFCSGDPRKDFRPLRRDVVVCRTGKESRNPKVANSFFFLLMFIFCSRVKIFYFISKEVERKLFKFVFVSIFQSL